MRLLHSEDRSSCNDEVCPTASTGYRGDKQSTWIQSTDCNCIDEVDDDCAMIVQLNRIESTTPILK
jgi:hypothetical protein